MPFRAKADKDTDMKKATTAMKKFLKRSFEQNQVTEEQYDMIAACLTAQGKGAPVSVSVQHLGMDGIGEHTQWTVVFNPISKEHNDYYDMISKM